MQINISSTAEVNRSIYRANPDQGFTKISNAMLQDKRVSYETRGLLAELLSRPDDWDVTAANIIKSGPAGRDKVYRMLSEAAKFGYMQPIKRRNEDGSYAKHAYAVSDDPDVLIARTAAEIYAMERPLPENPEMAVSNPFTGNPEVDSVIVPFPGKPEVDKTVAHQPTSWKTEPLPENPDHPLPGNPLTANRRHTKERDIQRKESKGSFPTDSMCLPNVNMSVPPERDDSLSRAAAALLIGLASSIPLADARADLTPVAQQGLQVAGGTSLTDGSNHAKPKRASPRKRTAVEYSDAFCKAWDAYPRTATMSKAAAWKSWQREGCESMGDAIAAAAAAESVRCERENVEPRFRKHMQGWLSEHRWEGMAESVNKDAERTEEQQVKAIALGFATGNWEHAKRWWQTSQDIPQRIRDLGRAYAQRELSST